MAHQPPAPAPEDVAAGFLADLARCGRPASTVRARREAALSSLLAWAYRAELTGADPMTRMTRLDRTGIPASLPRPMPAGHADAVLRAIPAEHSASYRFKLGEPARGADLGVNSSRWPNLRTNRGRCW